MIPFQGRRHHIVELSNKPIPADHNVWALGDNDYVYDWLWHSWRQRARGYSQRWCYCGAKISKGPKLIYLAPALVLVIRLTQRLREYLSKRIFCLHLNNLFPNTHVAHDRIAVDICMVTTRKNAQEVPVWLIEIKSNGHSPVWNSTLAEFM